MLSSFAGHPCSPVAILSVTLLLKLALEANVKNQNDSAECARLADVSLSVVLHCISRSHKGQRESFAMMTMSNSPFLADKNTELYFFKEMLACAVQFAQDNRNSDYCRRVIETIGTELKCYISDGSIVKLHICLAQCLQRSLNSQNLGTGLQDNLLAIANDSNGAVDLRVETAIAILVGNLVSNRRDKDIDKPLLDIAKKLLHEGKVILYDTMNTKRNIVSTELGAVPIVSAGIRVRRTKHGRNTRII